MPVERSKSESDFTATTEHVTTIIWLLVLLCKSSLGGQKANSQIRCIQLKRQEVFLVNWKINLTNGVVYQSKNSLQLTSSAQYVFTACSPWSSIWCKQYDIHYRPVALNPAFLPSEIFFYSRVYFHFVVQSHQINFSPRLKDEQAKLMYFAM